jgi:hypothetical protein
MSSCNMSFEHLSARRFDWSRAGRCESPDVILRRLLRAYPRCNAQISDLPVAICQVEVRTGVTWGGPEMSIRAAVHKDTDLISENGQLR